PGTPPHTPVATPREGIIPTIRTSISTDVRSQTSGAVKPPNDWATTISWSRSPIALGTGSAYSPRPAGSFSTGRSGATTWWPRSWSSAATRCQYQPTSPAQWINAYVAIDSGPALRCRGPVRSTRRRCARVPAHGIDDLHRAAGKSPLALEGQSGVGADRRRELHPVPGEQRQHDELELVEGSEGAERLDRARAADQVDISASVARPEPFEQTLGIAVEDDMVGSAGRTVRTKHEYLEVL